MATASLARPTGAMALLLSAACAAPDPPDLDQLSAWQLFSDMEESSPAPGVEPYLVSAPLFSDHTEKQRWFRVQPGGIVDDLDDAPWDLPRDSVLIKTFSMPADLRDPEAEQRRLETRLLVRTDEGWEAVVFVWDDDGQDATRMRAGTTIDLEWIDAEGTPQRLGYLVPNENQCADCHGQDDAMAPLGVRTRQLNRTNREGRSQLTDWGQRGLLRDLGDPQGRPRLPDPFDPTEALEPRARAYLDTNCAHCHRRDAPAESSGLWLEWDNDRARELGICKRPFSAGAGTGGHDFDIVPGDPQASIMVHRVKSTDPEIKMPEMPTQLADERGAALIEEWIAAMPPDDCR